MLPKKLILVIIKETAKQFKVVQDLMRSGEVADLVIATDAGRKGNWWPAGSLRGPVVKTGALLMDFFPNR